jgi:Kef-type K+ transport system membrane component KefB
MFALDLLVVLLAAFVGRVLSKRLGQPAILGEIAMGMVIGSLASFDVVLVGSSETLNDLGNAGALILLFSAGLVTSLDELKRLGKPSLASAFGGVVLPFVLGYIASIWFGYSNTVALLVGTGLVATSVGVNAEILSELRVLRSWLGTLIMATAIADDVIGILIVSFMISFATSGVMPISETLIVLALTVAFFVLSLWLGVRLVKNLSRRVRLGRYDLLLAGIIFAVAVGIVADAIGLAMMIGGFVAGLMLGQSDFSPRLIQESTLVGESFFVPIFFVTTGMGFRFHAIVDASAFAAVIVVVAILGKMIGCGLGIRLSGFSRAESAVVGIAMVPRAGIELVLIKLGLDAGIFGDHVVSSLLLMVIVTTMLTPPLLNFALRRLDILPRDVQIGRDSNEEID